MVGGAPYYCGGETWFTQAYIGGNSTYVASPPPSGY
jgi:hypothetical protein